MLGTRDSKVRVTRLPTIPKSSKIELEASKLAFEKLIHFSHEGPECWRNDNTLFITVL